MKDSMSTHENVYYCTSWSHKSNSPECLQTPKITLEKMLHGEDDLK